MIRPCLRWAMLPVRAGEPTVLINRTQDRDGRRDLSEFAAWAIQPLASVCSYLVNWRILDFQPLIESLVGLAMKRPTNRGNAHQGWCVAGEARHDFHLRCST